jgi:hypothetical protein
MEVDRNFDEASGTIPQHIVAKYNLDTLTELLGIYFIVIKNYP